MKKTFKTASVLLLSAVLILSSAACAGTGSTGSAPERKDIDWDENELFGAAFLGYAETLEDESIKDALKKYQDTYSVISSGQEIKSVPNKGSEVYLLIMRYPDAAITINNLPEGEGIVYGDVIFTGSSQALLLICNTDDKRSDCRVLVEYKDQKAELIPQIDLIAGCLAAEAEGPVRDLTFPREGTQITSAYAGSDALTGTWVLYTDYGDFTAVLQLSFEDSVKMKVVNGYYLSEIVEILEGEYCFAGPNHIKYPEGTLIFRLVLTFSMGDYPVDIDPPLVIISGAYRFQVNGDTLILNRVGGSELIYEENVPLNVEYTFEREADN